MRIFVTSLQRYKRQLKRLEKKYRTALEQSILISQEIRGGERPGDAIPGYAGEVYKARRNNSAVSGGLRKGYRFVYYIHSAEEVFMLSVYAKTEQANISDSEITELLKDVDRQLSRD